MGFPSKMIDVITSFIPEASGQPKAILERNSELGINIKSAPFEAYVNAIFFSSTVNPFISFLQKLITNIISSFFQKGHKKTTLSMR
jgi:hypothetical protein